MNKKRRFCVGSIGFLLLFSPRCHPIDIICFVFHVFCFALFLFRSFVRSIGMIDPILCRDRIDVKSFFFRTDWSTIQSGTNHLVWPNITTLYPIIVSLILTFLRAKCLSLFFLLVSFSFVLHAKVFIFIYLFCLFISFYFN